MSIGKRLKEERERLGMTIPEFAEIAGAKKNTVIDWQKDLSSPPAAKLADLAAAGVDVLYILTGQRSPANTSPATHLPAPNASTSTDLTPEHQALIANYDACAPDDRAAIRKVVAAAAKPHAVAKRKSKAS